MRLVRRTIEYAGISDPSSPSEIRVEILGLRNAIKQAEELISRHEQALEIAGTMERSIREAQHGIEGKADSGASEEAQEDRGGPPLVR